MAHLPRSTTGANTGRGARQALGMPQRSSALLLELPCEVGERLVGFRPGSTRQLSSLNRTSTGSDASHTTGTVPRTPNSSAVLLDTSTVSSKYKSSTS